MTKERAFEIATSHARLALHTITWIGLADGRHLHIQTVFEPDYYEDTPYVCYIEIQDENGDAEETHTTEPNNISEIAFWIYELCYALEEREGDTIDEADYETV